MSTVALVPQPPELARAGGAGAAPSRSGMPPTGTPAPADPTAPAAARVARTSTKRSLTATTLTSTTTATTPPRSTTTRTTPAGTTLAGASTGRIPVRSCAGSELGWQPVADRPPLRLTRRGRVLVAALTVLVFGAAVLVLGLRAAGALTDGPRFSQTTSVQVGAGQTLWSVAAETNPDQDPRVVIDEIVKLNGLRHAGDVTPGQTLIVPKP